jgi:hypothetical protein
MPDKREATDKEKAALTQASINAVNLSQNLPVPALQAADSLAIGINQKLDTFLPFGDSGEGAIKTATSIAFPIIGLWRALTQETWASSQIIRANCQQARSNVKARTGQVDRRVQGPLRDVSVLDETVKNVASKEFVDDVRKRVEECARDPLKCTADPTANLWNKFWDSIPLSAKIVGGAALLGVTLFYVGPVIRAGGMLATKAVGRKGRE